MRVLAFVPLGPPYAGPEVSNSILLKGCNCDLLKINTSFQKSNADKGRITLKGILAYLKNILRLLFEIFRFKPEIFYYNISATPLGALKDFIVIGLVRPFVWRVVVHMRGGHFGRFYESANILIKLLVRWYLVKCDRIIVQSENLKKQFLNLVPESKIFVVPNPASSDLFNIKPNLMGKNILFIGHLSKAKGWTDLLKVLPEILELHKDAKVIAVGSKIKNETNIVWVDGEDPDEVFEEYIRKNRLEDRFEFYENVSGKEKVGIFERASLFVLPSYSEGFPMAVLEAMAAGLPVISTVVGAIPEFLPKENPIVEPGDLKSLRWAILKVLEDENLRFELSRINREKAWEFEEGKVRRRFWEVILGDIKRSV